MSTLHGRTRVNPNGELLIAVPRELNGQVVEYTLIVETAHPTSANGSGSASSPLSQSEWERVVRETQGSCPDFPDIERPGPDSYEKRKSSEYRFEL